MSSTYFRNVECFKKNLNGSNIYVLIYETAESNVRTFDNKLDWHKWIYECGSYYELMRKVCICSYEFEDGCSQWKPSNKTPEGFIHTCRKAIKEAKESNLLYPMTAVIIDKLNEDMKTIGMMLSNIPNVTIQNDSYTIYLKSNDIETIYWMRCFVDGCKNNYKNMKPLEFAKWFCNGNNYNFTYEPILNLFKD